MKIAISTVESVSPYSQSKHHSTAKLEKESAQDYEARTWRERLHVTDDGTVFIPPMAFKNSLAEAAKFLSERIPGKGKATYTKHFEAGVLVTDGLILPLKKPDVEGEWLYLNADGRKGSGTRVERCYPVIRQWAGEVTFYILDETITQDVFRHHLEEAGKFIGLGRFRPRNGGFYGRYTVKGLKWNEG